LLRFTLDPLHVEWDIYMVSSFHLTRSAKLRLAHRMDTNGALIAPRFKEFLRLLTSTGVEYLLVGGPEKKQSG